MPYCEAHKSKGALIDCTYGGHIDHIIPRSKGGAELDFANLMTLCHSCHSVKTQLEQTYEVKHIGEEGERIPADGEKDKLLQLLTERIL